MLRSLFDLHLCVVEACACELVCGRTVGGTSQTARWDIDPPNLCAESSELDVRRYWPLFEYRDSAMQSLRLQDARAHQPVSNMFLCKFDLQFDAHCVKSWRPNMLSGASVFACLCPNM